MFLDDLATELITQIFLSCSTIADVLSLASTSHRFHSIYTSSRKLTILAQAAEQQYGPLEDAIQLVTHNDSQPVHILRTVPLSMALLKQLLQVGRVATRWEDIYPLKKWKADFTSRRLLTPPERRRLRRALYRLWLYTRAFHNAAHPRLTRLQRPIVRERAALLHNWSTPELAEIADVHAQLRDVLATNICPSNGTVLHKFRKRCPDPAAQLMFNVHLNYPPPPPAPQFHAHSSPAGHAHAFAPSSHRYRLHDATSFTTSEGWGDAITHYYTIEDMLKLDPAQILALRDCGAGKAAVEAFVKGLGEWFENNGDTWGQTVQFVLHERGEVGADEFVSAVGKGRWGVACDAGSSDDDDDDDWEEDAGLARGYAKLAL